MTMHKCSPGDLAVIVYAYNTVNIGTIVKVLAVHQDQLEIQSNPDDVLWTCQAAHPMTYAIGSRKKKRAAQVAASNIISAENISGASAVQSAMERSLEGPLRLSLRRSSLSMLMRSLGVALKLQLQVASLFQEGRSAGWETRHWMRGCAGGAAAAAGAEAGAEAGARREKVPARAAVAAAARGAGAPRGASGAARK
jgi:hypothetical protein